MNLLLDELPWIDQLREYYTAQLIGHMLADPDKAVALRRHFKTTVIAPQLPLTIDQKEAVREINTLVSGGRPASEYMGSCDYWPDGQSQPLGPWAKVLKDSAALVLIIGAHTHVEAATEDMKLLRIAPALEKLKAAVWLLEQHHNL